MILNIAPSLVWGNVLSGSFPKEYARLINGLSKQDLREIKVGYSLFAKPWVQAPSSTIRRDGLGPHFSATSCISCHRAMGRAHPDDLGLVIKSGSQKLIHDFGNQITPFALPHLIPEGIQENNVSKRIAPHLAGLGHIELISDSDIIENSKNNGGIISYTDSLKIGRFGWKAEHATIETQVAAAFNNDMGITSYLFPHENCTPQDLACLNSPTGADEEDVEIRKDHLLMVVKLMRSIKAPQSVKNIGNSVGETLFNQANCQSCHRPSYQVAGKIIYPYTDLLLHDMGDKLADNTTLKNNRLWKTPPLWGLSHQRRVNGHTRLMHDGRAKNISDAIKLHDGEALPSKQSFLNFSPDEQKQLIQFVESL